MSTAVCSNEISARLDMQTYLAGKETMSRNVLIDQILQQFPAKLSRLVLNTCIPKGLRFLNCAVVQLWTRYAWCCLCLDASGRRDVRSAQVRQSVDAAELCDTRPHQAGTASTPLQARLRCGRGTERRAGAAARQSLPLGHTRRRICHRVVPERLAVCHRYRLRRLLWLGPLEQPTNEAISRPKPGLTHTLFYT